MAKKSKSVRQYNKQIQRLNKINRKAQQKGLKLDLRTPTPKETRVEKKQLQDIRATVKRATEQVKEPKSSSTFKLTTKQIAKAVQKRQRIAEVKNRIKKISLAEPTENQIDKEKTKDLRDIINKNRRKTTPEDEQITEDEYEEIIDDIKEQKRQQREREKRAKEIRQTIENNRKKYTPEEPETEPQDTVNEDNSFYVESVITHYRQEISHYPSHAEPLLNNWLDSMITKYGREMVAKMLQDGAEAGVILTREIAYDDELLQGYISDMLDYLPEMEDWAKADVLDSFDSWVDIE